MPRVTSRQNPRLRDAARLIASSRDRRKAGRCVLEGEHLVSAYCARHGTPETLIVTDGALARDAVRALVERDPARALVVAAATFDAIATLPAAVGVLAVVPTPVPSSFEFGDFCMLLDGVQDPGNVGSMLRSAAAAGARQVLLSAHCAFAWSPKVLRAGQGAHFLLDIHEDADLPAWAGTYRESGGDVAVAIVAGGAPLYDAALGGRIAFAFGNEGAGISAGLAAQASIRVTIPMPGGTESLNAAAAAAVCLFESVRQRSPGCASRNPGYAPRAPVTRS